MTTDTPTKVCTGCSEEKILEEFSRKITGRLGRDSRCKVCISERDKKASSKNNARRRKRYKEDPEYRQKLLEKNSRWQKRNLDSRNQYTSSWKKENPEKVKNHWDKHYQKNREKYLAKAAARHSRVKQATPPWANLKDIELVYALCRKISKLTGIPHEVDHAVPLNGVDVCGLHTFNNLQIIPKDMNRTKSNNFQSDVLEPHRQRPWE